MRATGVPMAVASKRLWHATITITSDTYSHLLAGVSRDAAERANALVPRASRDQSVTNPVAGEPNSNSQRDGGPWKHWGRRARAFSSIGRAADF
jgi:hypothetical protein